MTKCHTEKNKWTKWNIPRVGMSSCRQSITESLSTSIFTSKQLSPASAQHTSSYCIFRQHPQAIRHKQLPLSP